MNKTLIEFLLIFCLISAVAAAIVGLIDASADPVETVPAVVCGVLAVGFLFGASRLNTMRKAAE